MRIDANDGAAGRHVSRQEKARAAPPSVLDRAPEPPRAAPLVALLGAAAVHALAGVGALALGSPSRGTDAKASTAITRMVDIELRPALAPSPLSAPPEARQAAAPARAPRVRPPREAPREALAPAAAKAGEALTRERAPDEIVDFDDSLVTGGGTTYAGGVTAPSGTATSAVRDGRALAGGVEGGTGRAVDGVDRSREPALAGASRWDCPFPSEADEAGIDHAVVTLRVDVAADGGVRLATVTDEPGHGFGREARRCALSKRWLPGLDRAGGPVAATSVVNVRFDR